MNYTEVVPEKFYSGRNLFPTPSLSQDLEDTTLTADNDKLSLTAVRWESEDSEVQNLEIPPVLDACKVKSALKKQ